MVISFVGIFRVCSRNRAFFSYQEDLMIVK